MSNRPLKRSKTGMEIEYHIIDHKGSISVNANELIKETLKRHPDLPMYKEMGQNHIEFGCFPHVVTFNPVLEIINSIETASAVLQEHDHSFYPFATYPGRFAEKASTSAHYNMKKKILGDDRFMKEPHFSGFHHHYTLPKGVFNSETKELRVMRKSKLKDSLISAYNFEIAADAALALICQCSPFYWNSQFAKDTRMIAYRGGSRLRYPDGVYGKLQQLGGLQPYKQTVTDLVNSIERRWKRWKREIRRVDKKFPISEVYPYKMMIGWNPVKINIHGTLEQRGMDTNLPSILAGVTVLLKFSLRKIQQDFLKVQPEDHGIAEAFKVEDGALYIPPHSYVRNKLQMWSAYDGYEKKEVSNYLKRFWSYAKSVTPKRYGPIIRPIMDMIDNQKSMSDKIIQLAKRRGFLHDGKISQPDAAELALELSKQLPIDAEITKRKLEKLSPV